MLPGGNLPTYTLASEFYLGNGRFGSPASGTLEQIALTFTLVRRGMRCRPFR